MTDPSPVYRTNSQGIREREEALDARERAARNRHHENPQWQMRQHQERLNAQR